MRIFVSSLIGGMEEIRDAAKRAITELGHQPVLAEDFRAQPRSPQVACLDGVRQAAAFVLILGDRYGTKQPSGLSATHEEYREAKQRCPVFVVCMQDGQPDPDQERFIAEVGAWQSGAFFERFRNSDELRAKLTGALHTWEVSLAAGPLDGADLLARAVAQLPSGRNRHLSGRGPNLCVSLAAGPTQAVLRPSELEAGVLRKDVQKNAMFGEPAIFDTRLGSEAGIANDALVVRQENGSFISLDTQGSIILALPVSGDERASILIEETVGDVLRSALSYADWLLDRIDPTQRLSHFALAVAITDASHQSWRTRAEHAKSPNSYRMRMGSDELEPVHLTPAHRPRAALRTSKADLMTDLLTLLGRRFRA